jgi:hypothetical protein
VSAVNQSSRGVALNRAKSFRRAGRSQIDLMQFAERALLDAKLRLLPVKSAAFRGLCGSELEIQVRLRINPL